jgi:hypothetical protein
MRTTVFALAAAAALGFSGAAFAGDATKTAGPAAMTDSQMDAVTAGSATATGGPGNVVTLPELASPSALSANQRGPNGRADDNPATRVAPAL